MQNELKQRIAWLESRLDLVESELTHIHQLLLQCGFPEGVETLKVTINELLEEAGDLPLPPNEDYPPTQTFNPFE